MVIIKICKLLAHVHYSLINNINRVLTTHSCVPVDRMFGTEMESPDGNEKKAASHPAYSVMVETAIKTLAEHKGSSLQAIMKYISANYFVDVQKQAVFVKKSLKKAVESGDLVQTSGKGASGSFKIGNKKVEEKPKTTKVKAKNQKAEKPQKMQTSTPKKASKSKKAPIQSPGNSPVTVNDQEVPADTTFEVVSKIKKPIYSVPSKARRSKVSLPMKMKKPKKLMAKKVKEPNPAVSPEAKADNTMTAPKHVKAKGAAKSAKANNVPKPKKPAVSNSKKTGSKKASAAGGQEENSS